MKNKIIENKKTRKKYKKRSVGEYSQYQTLPHEIRQSRWWLLRSVPRMKSEIEIIENKSYPTVKEIDDAASMHLITDAADAAINYMLTYDDPAYVPVIVEHYFADPNKKPNVDELCYRYGVSMTQYSERNKNFLWQFNRLCGGDYEWLKDPNREAPQVRKELERERMELEKRELTASFSDLELKVIINAIQKSNKTIREILNFLDSLDSE